MKRLKAIFYVFIKSLTSPKYYNDVVKTDLRFSLKYFSVLALIASLIVLATLVKPITQDLKLGLVEMETEFVSSYPEDLVITLQAGELSINMPEPYFVEAADDAGFENVLVFDSNGTLDDLDNYDTLILVNKTNVLARESGKIQVYPLSEFPDTKIGIDEVRVFMNDIKPFINALPWIVLGFAFLGIIIYHFGFRLMFLLLVAVVLFAFGNIRGLNLKFSKYYQVAIHALTLPLLIEVLAGVFKYPINMPFWFMILTFMTFTVLIGIAGLLNVEKSPVDATK